MEKLTRTDSWQALTLPTQQRDMLRQMVLQVKQKPVAKWLGKLLPGTLGRKNVSALFTGNNSTARTLAAQVLARELGFKLQHVDISKLVNKYIGETEKNLARVFDAAESSDVVLLLDEADALFGKRSEVKDSHDRYANAEVSYLLQRMESHQGVVILASNMRDNIDSAFLRRLRFVIEFSG